MQSRILIPVSTAAVVVTVIAALSSWNRWSDQAWPSTKPQIRNSSSAHQLGTISEVSTDGRSGPAAVYSGTRVAQGPDQARVQSQYGKLPLQFEVNKGQTDRRVKYLSRGPGYGLFLTGNEAVLRLNSQAGQRDKPAVRGQKSGDARAASKEHPGIPGALAEAPARGTRMQETSASSVLRMRLKGSNPQAQAAGEEELPGKSNYFIGNDPSKWRTDVANYSKVRYRDVYPGVDLVYYGNQRQLEYDLVVAPGTDPGVIRLAFAGARRMSVGADGDLKLQLRGGKVFQHRPLVYQEIAGNRGEIAGAYKLMGRQEVGLRLGPYDHTKPLVIDPVLVDSTYLGGSDADGAAGIAVDSSGNAYVTGQTSSTDFPTSHPAQPTYAGGTTQSTAGDAFVTKLNALGTAVVYSTFLGGSFNDQGKSIAVDGAGNAYVTGITSSSDFPLANPFQSTFAGTPPYADHGFVTKLDAAGDKLLYSTFLGGSGADSCYGIAVDGSGNSYVTGQTESSDFPTAHAIQPSLNTNGFGADAFITELNASGTGLVYSTYLGGSDIDAGNAIAVDSSGSAYVTGFTDSTDFPLVNAEQSTTAGGDAFVTKLSPGGTALVYSTYLGGSRFEEAKGIAVDGAGEAYVTGFTQSADFPLEHAEQSTLGGSQDAFVTKLKSDGTALLYSTYLGGSDVDTGSGIAVDSAGDAYITGSTSSSDFPVASAVQSTYHGAASSQGGSNAFITKLNPAGNQLVYSTYLGGSAADAAGAVAVDTEGNCYIAGGTTSSDFPTLNAFQSTLAGPGDAFITKLGPSFTISGRVTANDQNLSGVTITLSGASSATATTGADGSYTFINLAPANNYKVTPSLANYNFSPPELTFDNLNSDQTGDFTATLNTYTIKGNVSYSSAGLRGVTVTLSGSSAGMTTTDSNGNYAFTNVTATGSYTITPSIANYTFAPPNQTFTDLSGNQTADFTAILNHYTISGRVTSGMAGLSGVAIRLSGSASAITITDNQGNYSLSGVAALGNYTITPSLANYSFAPTSSTFTNLSGNQTANFTATLNHYTISGQVTAGGKGLGGVTMTLSGSSAATTTTTSSGAYSFGNSAAGGNYTITPSLTNYTFAPTSSTFNNLGANQTANFNATLNQYSISGQVTSGATGLTGVTITLSGSSMATSTTNSGGNFSFANLAAGGNYTVTPSLATYTFVPPNKTFSSLSSNQAQNFIATPTASLSTVQFSQPDYPAMEGCVATTITVSRTGDLTQQSSVDYKTHDGTATQKTNYTFAAGTLEFTAGQAMQTFPVLLTENGYVQGPTTATIVLSNPVNATLGPINSATLTIDDNDNTNNQPNPIDNPGIFACQNYHDFLNRQPDQNGEAFWTSQTASCGGDQACLDDKRVNVSAAFFLSLEFQQTGYLVIRIHQESFAALPAYHEFLRETQQISKGVVVGQPGYQQVLEENEEQFASEWVAQSDFQARFGNLSNEQYVDALYTDAQVNPTTAEDREALVEGLNDGVETRASVLLKVANSKEVYNTQYNPAFVLMQYFGYLRRNPQDAPDKNLNGFNFWLSKLNQFTNPGDDVRDPDVALLRVKRAEMVKAFLVSTEYRKRFGPD